jgi:hypothetical protein
MPKKGDRQYVNGVLGEYDGTQWRRVLDEAPEVGAVRTTMSSDRSDRREGTPFPIAMPSVGERKTVDGVTGEWDGTNWRRVEAGQEPMTFGGGVKNLAKNVVEEGGNLLSGVKGAVRLGVRGAGAMFNPAEMQKLGMETTEVLRALPSALKSEGSRIMGEAADLPRSLYEKPITTLMDAATVIPIAGQAAKLTRIPALVKLGEGAALASKLDPINAVARGVTAGTRGLATTNLARTLDVERPVAERAIGNRIVNERSAGRAAGAADTQLADLIKSDPQFARSTADLEARFPPIPIDRRVGGMKVPLKPIREDYVNTLRDPEMLSGIREIPISELPGATPSTAGDFLPAGAGRTKMKPLLIVINENRQPRVVQGASRLEEARAAGAEAVPARVAWERAAQPSAASAGLNAAQQGAATQANQMREIEQAFAAHPPEPIIPRNIHDLRSLGVGGVAGYATGSLGKGIAAGVGLRALNSPRISARVGVMANSLNELLKLPGVAAAVRAMRAQGMDDDLIEQTIKRQLAGGGQ